MDDSLQSDTIQFEPTSRLSIGSNDTVVNETHELSTSSQDSFESNHNMHQSNISQEYPHSIGEILHLLKNEIRDTFKTIAEDNAVNLSMIQDRFHDKISNMKEYMQEQVSNIFQEINCLRTRPNNTQYIHAADVHRDEPSEIQVVPQPIPKQSSNHIPTSFRYMYQNNNNTTIGMQSHPNSGVNLTHNVRINMKPQPYDGTEDIEEYLSQFQILSEVNGWNYNIKSLCLASSLKGAARAILSELDGDKRRDYDSLVHALHNRFGFLHRSEIFRARLQTRVRKDNESLSVLSQDIKKLTRCAYPGAPSSVTDVLALDQFIDALKDPDMRLRIREARPYNINEAEILAVRLETFKQADNHRGKMLGETKSVLPVITDKYKNADMGKDIKEIIGDLKKELSTLSQEIKQNRNNNRNRYSNNYQGRKSPPFSQTNQNEGNNRFNHRNNQNNGWRSNSYHDSNQGQGNYHQSNSWAGARQQQNGPQQ